MDSLTQAVLGGAIGGLVLGRRLGRRAVIGGALLATLPDLDVLIDYGDAVTNFTQHRGFSHSLPVLTALAVLLALLLHRWRADITRLHWFAYCALVLLTHPLLDAFTTYGTQLWWPWGEPVSWHSIFIIDPLYTLPLLLAVLCSLYRPPAPLALSLGLLLSSFYLGWGLLAQHWIERRVLPVLAEQGWQDAPRLIQPMPFNTVLWRVTVLTEHEQVEIITGLLDDPDQALHIQRFPRDSGALVAAGQVPAGRQLMEFTGGFVDARVTEQGLVLTDIRLGLPGAYPFHFLLAVPDADQGWQPLVARQLPGPMINPAAWPILWDRLLVRAPLLCMEPPRLALRASECY